MGTFQKKARKASKKARSPLSNPTVTVNRAGGVAFDIEDQSVKLLTMVGARLDITEPSYYNADSCVATMTSDGRRKLEERVRINDETAEFVGDVAGLDDVAREIIATAVNVLNSDNTRDVLAIANWLRNSMHLRLTPVILLVIASMHPEGKKFVRDYANKVVARPDDIKNALLFWRYIRGVHSLPKQLAYGLSDALSKFKSTALLKYDGKHFPTWKDVLRWLPRKKDWPLNKSLRDYFVDGVIDAKKLPQIALRKKLAEKTVLDSEARKWIKKTRATWENVLSQFGSDKKACWEFLIKENMLGYMAMLRNLRNILEVDVDTECVDMIASKLGDADEVRKSRQLPFRFIAAANAIDSCLFTKHTSAVFEAIEDAVEVSCENVPVLPGVTAVFADNSGSMNCPVSEKSKLTCRDAANSLAGIIARRSDKAFICSFSETVISFKVTKHTSALSLARSLSEKSRPCGTETHLVFEWLIKQGLKVDRVIILSDMQAWNRSPWNTFSVAEAWDKYNKFCGKKKPWLHSVHLNGYGDNIVPADADRVNLVSGFSENIISMLLTTEGVLSSSPDEVTGSAVQLPTIEQIREEW